MIAKLARKFQRTNELNGPTYDRELSPLALADGVVINQDRSLGYGFRLDAPYTPALSDEAVEGAYGTLAGFLNALPEHFDLQVDLDPALAKRGILRGGSTTSNSRGGLVGEVQREQQENILGLLREGHLRWIEVYLILVRKLPHDDRTLRRMAARPAAAGRVRARG